MTEPIDGDRDNPFMGYQAAAVTMHELFTSLVEAGFSEDQALEIVKTTFLAAK